MSRSKQSKILILALTACAAFIQACGSNSNILRPAKLVPFPPGEYKTTAVTAAGLTVDSYVLALKAEERNDAKSVLVLRDKGMMFNIPKGTTIVLLPASPSGSTSVVGTVAKVKICTGTVASGEHIGDFVALSCDALTR
jgi:hypothetical protein